MCLKKRPWTLIRVWALIKFIFSRTISVSVVFFNKTKKERTLLQLQISWVFVFVFLGWGGGGGGGAYSRWALIRGSALIEFLVFSAIHIQYKCIVHRQKKKEHCSSFVGQLYTESLLFFRGGGVAYSSLGAHIFSHQSWHCVYSKFGLIDPGLGAYLRDEFFSAGIEIIIEIRFFAQP